MNGQQKYDNNKTESTILLALESFLNKLKYKILSEKIYAEIVIAH